MYSVIIQIATYVDGFSIAVKLRSSPLSLDSMGRPMYGPKTREYTMDTTINQARLTQRHLKMTVLWVVEIDCGEFMWHV